MSDTSKVNEMVSQLKHHIQELEKQIEKQKHEITQLQRMISLLSK